jgi:hypothetical protein
MIKKATRLFDRRHHNVYVVYLRNPNGDGKAGYYVGMTGRAGIRLAALAAN